MDNPNSSSNEFRLQVRGQDSGYLVEDILLVCYWNLWATPTQSLKIPGLRLGVVKDIQEI